MEKLYSDYKDRAAFLFVYIREAHPEDAWQMASNKREGVVFRQPKSHGERRGVAKRCAKALKLSMPCVVDDMKDTVDNLYAAWPERLFVIDREGKIAYSGGVGPFGFKPGEVRSWLEKNVGEPAS